MRVQDEGMQNSYGIAVGRFYLSTKRRVFAVQYEVYGRQGVLLNSHFVPPRNVSRTHTHTVQIIAIVLLLLSFRFLLLLLPRLDLTYFTHTRVRKKKKN